MFKHEKQLFHPVSVERPNPQYAALLQEQLGGGNGELKSAMQYMSQSFRIQELKIKDLFLDIAAEELLEQGAQEILSFGPALIQEGDICVTEEDEVGKAMASNPRTAIGIIDSLHYVFVVSDGRTEESEGLSLLELAELMYELGVETAYNLDGGGSSTMYFNGKVVNKPTTSGKSIKERSVSDIVYIGY